MIVDCDSDIGKTSDIIDEVVNEDIDNPTKSDGENRDKYVSEGKDRYVNVFLPVCSSGSTDSCVPVKQEGSGRTNCLVLLKKITAISS